MELDVLSLGFTPDQESKQLPQILLIRAYQLRL